jgi:hypothetical protein
MRRIPGRQGEGQRRQSLLKGRKGGGQLFPFQSRPGKDVCGDRRQVLRFRDFMIRADFGGAIEGAKALDVFVTGGKGGFGFLDGGELKGGVSADLELSAKRTRAEEEEGKNQEMMLHETAGERRFRFFLPARLTWSAPPRKVRVLFPGEMAR